MPKAMLGRAEEAAPLTVAKLADKVGVSTSTLRTWDRRYGLGPSSRTQGSHRRYTALDVARIELVVELIERGVSTCDAAREALEKNISEFQVDVQVDVNVPTLIDACVKGHYHVVRSILDRAIARDGLMRTWMDLMQPASDEIGRRFKGETPGYSAVLTLTAMAMHIMREMHDKSPCRSCAKNVLLIADRENYLGAHVLGVALTHHDLDVKVLSTNSPRLAEAVHEYLGGCDPDVTVVIGATERYMDLLEELAARPEELVVVGSCLPCDALPSVPRLHTLAAAAEEIPAMVAD